MRVDVVSIFPEYFGVLDVSLIGRARAAGILDVRVHDLRQWAEGRHRSVDAAPFGGGAGMVMRPDVWGRALDAVLEDAGPVVLAVPTPAGSPLTQRVVERLAGVPRLAIACGRYEGIDQRVVDHYRGRGLAVEEYSIGDYVVNGGEVAALVLIEAIARLLPGVVGNPESLVEESHDATGLLEYPEYTHPRSWRGLDVPDVLLSGDHAGIARWRRDRAVERTARRRPDLVRRLDPEGLDRADRELLAASGWIVSPEVAPVRLRAGVPEDAGALADLAARTFPLACPPQLGQADVRAFVAENLSAELFAQALAPTSPDRLWVAEVGRPGRLAGYTWAAARVGDEVGDLVRAGRVRADSAYLSKCYVDAPWQGSGIAGALLRAALADLAGLGAVQVALGTNIANGRAHRFYRHHGFRVVGRRSFRVGTRDMADDVLARDLP